MTKPKLAHCDKCQKTTVCINGKCVICGETST